jgi:hypothetical protein
VSRSSNTLLVAEWAWRAVARFRLHSPGPVLVLSAFIVLTGCTSQNPSASVSPRATAGVSSAAPVPPSPTSALSATTPVPAGAASAVPSATAAASSTTSATPAAATLTPSAVIDLPDTTSAIHIAADGDDVWIGVDGGVVHVDGQTNAQWRISAPDMQTGDGPLALFSDGLWIGSFSRNLIERLDPSTGQVELTGQAMQPKVFVVTGEDLWVGSHSDRGLFPVDRTTGELGTKIGTDQSWAYGRGALWEGDYLGAKITRFDPATGSPLATITVPDGTGCSVDASPPAGDLWAGCSVFQGNDGPDGATFVAIDPNTNTAGKTLSVPAYSAELVVDGKLWFIVPRNQPDGTIASSLVVIDPATGDTIASWDLGSLDADTPVSTSTALWIPDEQGHRVLKFDLATIRP